jgi:hydrogenase-4 component F
MFELLLLIPALTALICLLLRDHRKVEWVSSLGSVALLVASLLASYDVVTNGAKDEGMLYMDGLSAFMLMLVAIVSLATSLYSISYMRMELEEGRFAADRVSYYYALLHAFIMTMVLVCLSDNLGIMWIAIEATTLASAFLVSFYNSEGSLEAAWKYIIICSVGITLALLGTVLLYASSIQQLGEGGGSLEWSSLLAMADQLDPTLMRISFILVLVGYGTKVGLAPMHTWLPDAHSQAPTPISALLSGVLLNCAMYAILRYHMISSATLGPGFSGGLLVLFGVLSLAIAAAFIIQARDFKRLLAYSSIEHMGVIALGFGIGGTLGIIGGLLQMLNHALTKSALFFGAGQVYARVKTRTIEEIKGLSKVMPITSALWFAAFLAIVGCPPFGIFVSELVILMAGLQAGELLVVSLYLSFLAIIFAAVLYHASKMVFGNPIKEHGRREGDLSAVVLLFALLAGVLILGVYLPHGLNDMLEGIAHLFPGGGT